MFVSKPKSASDDWMPRFPPEFSLHTMKTSAQMFPEHSKTVQHIKPQALKVPYMSYLGGMDALRGKLGKHLLFKLFFFMELFDICTWRNTGLQKLDGSSTDERLQMEVQLRSFSSQLQDVDSNILERILSDFDQQAIAETNKELQGEQLTTYNRIVQRMLTSANTVSSGFILWIDFSSERNATIAKLLSRPNLLPALPPEPVAGSKKQVLTADEEWTKQAASSISR